MRITFCMLITALLAAPGVFAQTFPARTVRIVIPFPVGGSADSNARIIMPPLIERWKQQILIDPRPGAATVIGTTSPQAIVAHPSLPAKNARELVALARARPGQLNMGTAGSVLPVHYFNLVAKTKIEVVPYKGAAALVTDTMGGHIPLAIAAVSSMQGAVRAGRVRLIGVSSLTTSTSFPDAPLITKDIPDFEVMAWFGLLAPRGTPKDVVTRIRDDVAAVLQMSDTRQRLLEIGGDPAGNTPEEFAARVRTEIARWKKVAEAAGIKPQ